MTTPPKMSWDHCVEGIPRETVQHRQLRQQNPRTNGE